MRIFLNSIIYFVESFSAAKMIRLTCGLVVALCLTSPNSVSAAQKLTVSAIGSPAAAQDENDGILTGRAPRQTAANDFHDFVCAFNSSGGMLTAVVSAALNAEMDESDFSVSIDSKQQSEGGATSIASDLSFPWYRPDCARDSYLTPHTKALCQEFVWSEPIYEMLVGYFTASEYQRPLNRHEDVYGTTLCLAGNEFPQMLHEVGLSDLNTNLVYKRSPAACLKAVASGKADVTLLPIQMASLEIEHFDLKGQIVGNHHLDRVMTLHVVAPLASLTASDNIATFNQGLRKLRKSGKWFEIVAKFADGHDHDHAYDAGAEQNFAAKSP